jgi:ribosomal protein L11 methyltransferase
VREYYRVCGRLPAKEYELAIARWYARGMAGCEETAADDSAVAVTVYFNDKVSAERTAAELRQFASGGEVIFEPVVNEDWNARWRASMQPAQLAAGWWVSPVWLEPALEPGDRWIKIEPKMAFGTGHHETTRLAAQAIVALEPVVRGAALLDIGTGSGVLCFVAAMLGAARCTGIEIDPDCRENLSENLQGNSGVRQCSFVIGSLESVTPAARFDVMVMNMIHTESAPLLEKCSGHLAPGGTLIWSGILHDEYDRAVAAAGEFGFVLESPTRENEWWCGRFVRDGSRNSGVRSRKTE